MRVGATAGIFRIIILEDETSNYFGPSNPASDTHQGDKIGIAIFLQRFFDFVLGGFQFFV